MNAVIIPYVENQAVTDVNWLKLWYLHAPTMAIAPSQHILIWTRWLAGLLVGVWQSSNRWVVIYLVKLYSAIYGHGAAAACMSTFESFNLWMRIWTHVTCTVLIVIYTVASQPDASHHIPVCTYTLVHVCSSRGTFSAPHGYPGANPLVISFHDTEHS